MKTKSQYYLDLRGMVFVTELSESSTGKIAAGAMSVSVHAWRACLARCTVSNVRNLPRRGESFELYLNMPMRLLGLAETVLPVEEHLKSSLIVVPENVLYPIRPTVPAAVQSIFRRHLDFGMLMTYLASALACKSYSVPAESVREVVSSSCPGLRGSR